MALRFDLTPSNFTLIQFALPLDRFARGTAVHSDSIKMSTSPSLSKSPKAQPRLECASVSPGPASCPNSSNVPFPRLRNDEKVLDKLIEGLSEGRNWQELDLDLSKYKTQEVVVRLYQRGLIPHHEGGNAYWRHLTIN